MSAKTENFIKQVKDGGSFSVGGYKVLPSVAIAQAALESSWVTSGLSTKYNNLFGIKGITVVTHQLCLPGKYMEA